jgi:hypothetical protein
MWWMILLGIVLGGVVLGFVLFRTINGERRRVTRWNDLHARGELFTSQLAHLREVEASHAAPARPSVPHVGSAKKAGIIWRRRPSAARDASGSKPDPQVPV